MTSTCPTLRIGAALAVTFFVGAQLASLAHHVTVRHARCVEHGELVHVDADGARTSDDNDDQGVRTSESARGDHTDHEHCDAALGDPSLAARTGTLAAISASAKLSNAPTCVAHAPIDLAFIAPKTSPPV